jgi:exodeoxyribonuclease VII small subunit
MTMNDNKMTFEGALVRLEEITRLLEAGSAPLDESLSLFEEGVRLVRFCNEKLEDAKLKVLRINNGENTQNNA